MKRKIILTIMMVSLIMATAYAGMKDRFADLELVDVTATADEINKLDGLSGDVLTTSSTSTLTNKTLTSPKIVTTDAICDGGGDEYIVFTEATTPKTYVGITSGDTGVDPQIRGAGETNTDILIAGTGTGDVCFADGADVTKDIVFELVGASPASTMTIISSHLADRSLTLPDATDTLVGRDTTDTLTNKTLTSPTIGTGVIGTGVISATNITDIVRYYQLPLGDFCIEDSAAPLTTATAPGFELDDLVPGLVWADGETSKAMVTFRVPGNYVSGLAFKLFCTESNSTTPNQVDFEVLINNDGSAADSSATNQTPVALAGTLSTPDEVTLTVSTDFSSLTAGQWVTLKIWRDDVAVGTGDLEIKGAGYYCTETQ